MHTPVIYLIILGKEEQVYLMCEIAKMIEGKCSSPNTKLEAFRAKYSFMYFCLAKYLVENKQ